MHVDFKSYAWSSTLDVLSCITHSFQLLNKQIQKQNEKKECVYLVYLCGSVN